MISWFLLVLAKKFRGLSPYFWGSGASLPTFLFFLVSGKGFCQIMISLFLLVPAKKFRGLSPYFSLFSFLRKGIVFHYDFRVPSDSG